jgi:hypothetical protein
MLETLKINATSHTPQISFCVESGLMEIAGRSIPEEPDAFWLPVLNWFESYLLKPIDSTVFRINLEYFNISSSKRILFLLYKLNDLVKVGLDVRVEWIYKVDDEDMYEVGQDYAYMVKVPFVFKSYMDNDLSVAI